MSLGNFLRITKTDGTVHFVPWSQPALNRYNKTNQRLTDKMKIEEVTPAEMQEDIKNKKILDPSYRKNKADLVADNKAKDAEIERLRAQLAEKNTDTGAAAPVKLSAADAIAKINAATTVEEVDAVLVGETRTSVIGAADKKKVDLAG